MRKFVVKAGRELELEFREFDIHISKITKARCI